MLLHSIRKLREALRQPCAGRSRAPRDRVRLQVERLEQRNLMDGGFANVLVNDPTLDFPAVVNGVSRSRDTQSETTLVLGAGGQVVVAYNDTGSEIYFNGIREGVGYSVSPDGGASFQDRGAPPSNPTGYGVDPVLARSERTGTIFLATLTTYPAPGGQPVEDQINVFRSTDNGASFALPVNGAPGFVPGVDFQDKDWLAVDNYPGPGYGNCYLAWRDFSSNPANNGIVFTRSTDDGLTWGPDRGTLLATAGKYNVQGTYVTVGPDHAVYVFWLDQSQGAGSGEAAAEIRMRKSTDFGATFGASVSVASLNNHGRPNGELGLTDGSGASFRAFIFPQAAVNPATGDIYIIYPDRPTGNNEQPHDFKDRADIFFVQSSDGGAKWSKPVRVNDDATNNDQWQPALAVTPDGTHVGVFWYDRRLDPANNLIDRFGVVGTVSGHSVGFGPNFRITDVSFPPAFGQDLDPLLNPRYMGDYDQAVADNSYFYTTWADNRLLNPNYPSHVNQPDVRFAKIPVSPLALTAARLPAQPASAGISDVTKAEGQDGQTTLFTFTVTLSAAYDQAVTISYSTVNGTATAGEDYVAKTGTLTFAPGETSKTITIEVKGDSKKEANETFYLDLFDNSSNLLFTKNRGIGTFLNDD